VYQTVYYLSIVHDCISYPDNNAKPILAGSFFQLQSNGERGDFVLLPFFSFYWQFINDQVQHFKKFRQGLLYIQIQDIFQEILSVIHVADLASVSTKSALPISIAFVSLTLIELGHF
jgi:hypothetical protein